MTTPMHFPGPRDGLDEGSLAELAQDGREIEADLEGQLRFGHTQQSAQSAQSEQSEQSAQSEREQPQARPSVPSTAGPIDVPEDACALIEGLAAYGA
jgi:hypothetical protein